MDANKDTDFSEDWRTSSHATSTAIEILDKLLSLQEGQLKYYESIDAICPPLLDGDEKPSGARLAKEYLEISSSSEPNPWDAKNDIERVLKISSLMMRTSAAFCAQALMQDKNTPIAWSFVADANLWLGVLSGYLGNLGEVKNMTASEFGKKGANASHAENRALKEFLMKWCDDNMRNYKSMDAAAAATAEKLVPVKFRTARAWIGEWKKLQSAGKP